MSAVRWPEAVAAGISLLEVAVGPEIAEEAFAIAVGMDTFGAACRRADAKARGRDDPELKRLQSARRGRVVTRRLVGHAEGGSTLEVTVEAIKQAVRAGGAEALGSRRSN